VLGLPSILILPGLSKMGFPTEVTPATQEDIRLLNNRIASNETVIQEINKWRMAHAGIDVNASGLDYPHPVQKVRTLEFGQELDVNGHSAKGKLSLDGLILSEWMPVGWVPELAISPQFAAANPWVKMYGQVDTDNTSFELKANWDADDNASLSLLSQPGATGAAGLSVNRGGNISSISINLSGDTIPGELEFGNVFLSHFPGFSSDPAAATTEGDQWYRSDLGIHRTRTNGANQNVSLDGDWSTKTIASGVLTVTTSRHKVDTQGAAATDDLDTLTGLNDGGFLILTAVSAARVVTAKDGTGNLRLASDCPLASPNDTLVLVKQGSNWLEISRSVNG